MNNQRILELVTKILIFKQIIANIYIHLLEILFKGKVKDLLRHFCKFVIEWIDAIIRFKKVMKSDQKLLNAQVILLKSINELIYKTNFQLRQFLGLQTFLLKEMEDGINALFAGFIAGGLSFVTQEENVKYQFRVHLFGRAVDCIYKTQVQKSIQTKKIIPVLVFALMSNLISLILPLDTYKMYQSFPGDEMNDSLWHMCTVQVWRKKLMQLAESYFIMVKL